MINMSYCMFENTLKAIEEINNGFDDNEIDLQDMSEYERNSFSEISEQSLILVENIEKYKNRVLEVLNYGSWEEINWEEVSALDLLSEQD